MDTEEAIESVRINGVSVLSLSIKQAELRENVRAFFPQ